MNESEKKELDEVSIYVSTVKGEPTIAVLNGYDKLDNEGKLMALFGLSKFVSEEIRKIAGLEEGTVTVPLKPLK